MKILKEGLATCIYEPRGEYGLEDYQLERGYHYQIKSSVLYEKEHISYWVFPDKNDMEYCERCAERVFKKYFKSMFETDYEPMEEIT